MPATHIENTLKFNKLLCIIAFMEVQIVKINSEKISDLELRGKSNAGLLKEQK